MAASSHPRAWHPPLLLAELGNVCPTMAVPPERQVGKGKGGGWVAPAPPMTPDLTRAVSPLADLMPPSHTSKGIFPFQPPTPLGNPQVGSRHRLSQDTCGPVRRVPGGTWYLLMLQTSGRQYLNLKQMEKHAERRQPAGRARAMWGAAAGSLDRGCPQRWSCLRWG